MEDDYETFDANYLRGLTLREFEGQLKAKRCDKVEFLNRALTGSLHRKAVLKHFTYNWKRKNPLKALSIQGSFGSVSDEDANKFLSTILGRQKSQLRSLEINDPIVLNTEVSLKINQWMTNKQCSSFTLTNSKISAANLVNIFNTREGEIELCVKEVSLKGLLLNAGCLRNLTCITRLRLKDTQANDIVWGELCYLVKNSLALKVLITDNIIRTRKRATLLGTAVAQNESIERLDVMVEEDSVAIPIVEHVFENQRLTEFNFRPSVFPYDTSGLFEKLQEVLPSAKSPLSSLNFGRIQIPDEIKALLLRAKVVRENGMNSLGELVNKLNSGVSVKSQALKITLVGSGSQALQTELTKQTPTFQQSIPVRKNQVLLVENNIEALPLDNLVVGVGNSDHVYAHLVIDSLKQVTPQQRHDEKPGEGKSLVVNDLINYCARTGYNILEPPSEFSSTVVNMWLGFKAAGAEIPFVKQRHEEGGVYFVSFFISDLLSSRLCDEFRKLAWILQKIPDNVRVFLVGLMDDDVVSERLNYSSLDVNSFKNIAFKKLLSFLPERVLDRLESKQQHDKDPEKPEHDNIFFVGYPFTERNNNEQKALWRAVDPKLETDVSDIDSRWHIILNAVKSEGLVSEAYASFGAISEVAALHGVQNIFEMVEYFERTGELLVLNLVSGEYRETSLVVFNKIWLQSKLESISSEIVIPKEFPHTGVWPHSYMENIFETEEDWVSELLINHAEDLGLLVKLGESGEFLLPQAVVNQGYNQRYMKRYMNSQPLFWIEVPHQCMIVEFFNIFSSIFLRSLLIAAKGKNSRQFYWRDVDCMGYNLDSSDECAWARFDQRKERILFGMPKQSLFLYSSFLESSKKALKETILILASKQENIFEPNSEDIKLRAYPRLVLTTVTDTGEVVQMQCNSMDSLDVKHNAMPPSESVNVLAQPIPTDVCIICINRKSRDPYMNFLGSLLQLEGLSVDCKDVRDMPGEDTYGLLVVLLGNDDQTAVKKTKTALRRRNGYLVRCKKNHELSAYKEIFSSCKSLETQKNPEAGLEGFVVDVLSALRK